MNRASKIEKVFLSLLLLLVCAGIASAQSSAVSGQAITPYGTPAAGARVRVCAITTSGIPCSPASAIYSDPGLTQPLSNPMPTDQYGNYKFFVNAGTYILQVTIAGAAQPTFIYYVTAGVTGGCVGGLTTCLPPVGTLEVQASPNTGGTTLAHTGIFVDSTAQLRYTNDINTPINPRDSQYTSNYTGCIHDNPLIGYTAGSTFNLLCRNEFSENSIPGIDTGAGFSDLSPTAFTTMQHYYAQSIDRGIGLQGGLGIELFKFGPNDTHTLDIYNHSMAGNYGSSNEGVELIRGTEDEIAFVYQGVIDSVSGTTQFHIGSTTQGQNQQAPGRYVHRLAADVATNVVVSAVAIAADGIPSTVTLTSPGIDASYVSNFWCHLAADVPMQQQSSAPFTLSKTFHCLKDGGGSPVVSGASGNVLVFGSDFHDVADVTAVVDNGSGDWTITANIQSPHRAGGIVSQQKADLALALYPNRQHPFSFYVQYPIECPVAYSTTSLGCGQFYTGQIRWTGLGDASIFNETIPSYAAMTNTGGVVTVTNYAPVILNDQANITFTGATPSAFNGVCTTVSTAGNVLTCMQASSTGLTASVLPSVSIGTSGYGTAVGDVFAIAKVNDVRNPITYAVDNSFTLETHRLGLIVGDEIQEDHGYGGHWVGYSQFTDVPDMFQRENRTIDLTYGSRSMFAGTSGDGSPFFGQCGLCISGTPDMTQMQGFGGIHRSMSAVSVRMYTSYGLYMGIAPGPSGDGTALFVDCPMQDTFHQSCDFNHNYNYNIFALREGSGAPGFEGVLNYTPYTGTIFSNNLNWQFQDTRITIGGLNPCLENGAHCNTYIVSAGLKKWNLAGSNQWVSTTFADYVALWGSGSCTGYLKYDGTCTATTGGVLLSSATSQNVVQTFPSSLNATAMQGTFNEEFFAGADVNHRIQAAMTACGTAWNFVCNITIPPYASVDQTTMPIATSNNIVIIDERNVNGQGIFQGEDLLAGCTPYQVNCSNAVLPQLKGNFIYTARYGSNDPIDSINIVTSSTVTGCSITTNVATCTTTNPNNFSAGALAFIGNMQNLTFLNNIATNSAYTVLSSGLTSTQFRFNFTHADIAFTSDSGITGVLCAFCGKNTFNISAYADGGITHTNETDAGVQAATIGLFRAQASLRQTTALNVIAQGYMNQPGNFGNDFVQGVQINMTNRDALDPLSNMAGIGITLGANQIGYGILMNSSGNGYAHVGVGILNYDGYGILLAGGCGVGFCPWPARTADIHIVPPFDDGSHELEGQNAANNTTVWHIDSDGGASFPYFSRARFLGSITNGTGLQHASGALGCTTGAAVGATCTTAQLPWTVAFPDTNYELVCNLDTPTGIPTISTVSKNTTGFAITVAALTTAAATANYECIAIHN